MFVCPECGSAQPAAGRCKSDGNELVDRGEDLILGTTVGAYRVTRLIGIGGMGRVYKGVHPTIGSRVAIKVLSRECSDRRDIVDRFFAEARTINLIKHENIVNVLDLATLPDGRPYIVMEFLDGAPLSSVVETAVQQHAPMPLGGLARLAAEVLDALGAAHAKGIIHRDLKPDNVYVTPTGRAKVLDFGIAKLDDLSATKKTVTGSLLGTPHYMSPEQAEGKVADHRADIYAMGVILFECATGQRPFTGESLFELLRKHIEVLPPSLRALRPDMPADLEHVILVALAKSPNERWSTAEAMSVALQSATASLPADQWAPITGSGVRTSGSNWSPTPPASWARSGRSSVPPPQGPTVSSGQVTAAPPKKKNRTGIWIAVSVVLAGGGIMAAVIATRGGDHRPDEPGSSSIRPEQVAVLEPPLGVPPPPTIIEPDKPIEAEAPVVDDDASAEQKAMELIKKLPPEQQVELAPLLDLAKLPKDERRKRLSDLTNKIGKLTINKAPIAVPPPSGWPKGGRTLSWSFDPKRADTGAYVKWALAQAKLASPDIALTRIDLEGVRADGTADITLPTLASSHGSLDLRFVSPSRTKRDPAIPLGVPYEWDCEMRVELEPDGVEARTISGHECTEPIIAIPKCNAVALWQRAIAKQPALAGANAVASISYYGFATTKGVGFWYFSIKDVISERFADDC